MVKNIHLPASLSMYDAVIFFLTMMIHPSIYSFIYLFIHLFIYLFMAVLGLRFCARAFL